MAFVYDDVVEFQLREKLFSLSGDSFIIKNADTDEEVFKVDGNALSVRDSKTLLNAEGNELFKMSSALISLHSRMNIEECAEGNVIATIKKKGIINLPIFGGRTVNVWRGDSDEGDPWLTIEGDLIRKDFVISEGETEVAVISRKLLSMETLFTDKDEYCVRVNPGYDASLMLFIAIAIDEQYHEDD